MLRTVADMGRIEIHNFQINFRMIVGFIYQMKFDLRCHCQRTESGGEMTWQ